MGFRDHLYGHKNQPYLILYQVSISLCVRTHVFFALVWNVVMQTGWPSPLRLAIILRKSYRTLEHCSCQQQTKALFQQNGIWISWYLIYVISASFRYPKAMSLFFCSDSPNSSALRRWGIFRRGMEVSSKHPTLTFYPLPHINFIVCCVCWLFSLSLFVSF